MFAGFAQSFCIVSLTVLLLRTSDERFRGRVIGVRMLAIYSLPLGLLASGTLIDLVGFTATATIYIAVGLACIAAMALRWRAELWSAQPGTLIISQRKSVAKRQCRPTPSLFIATIRRHRCRWWR